MHELAVMLAWVDAWPWWVWLGLLTMVSVGLWLIGLDADDDERRRLDALGRVRRTSIHGGDDE